jgi:hypothetical protein
LHAPGGSGHHPQKPAQFSAAFTRSASFALPTQLPIERWLFKSAHLPVALAVDGGALSPAIATLLPTSDNAGGALAFLTERSHAKRFFAYQELGMPSRIWSKSNGANGCEFGTPLANS